MGLGGIEKWCLMGEYHLAWVRGRILFGGDGEPGQRGFGHGERLLSRGLFEAAGY